MKPTDETEIISFVGLLILAGAQRAGHQNLEDLWDQSGFGIEIFYTTMSLKRFLFLLRCLRFDDVRNRTERRALDKMAAFRNIFETFEKNCQKHYSVGEYTTVDEQLVAFRGKCPFRQYIPSKPAKYGVKILTLCDSTTWYTLSMEVYVGTQPDGPYLVSNSAKDVVMRLAKPIAGTNRNITADNWFCSVPLLEELFKIKLTLVGTLRKNKKELPLELVNTKNRPLKSSIFAFQDNMTLVSYVPKKNKNVLAISSMHFDDSIDPKTGDECKPEIITWYNATKAGVDVVDEMCATYSTSRRTRRWPMALFYRLLDIAGINAQVIYEANNGPRKVVRRLFLRDLGIALVRPQIKKRASNMHIPRTLREKAARISGSQKDVHSAGVSKEIPEEITVTKPGRCVVCPRNKDIKTKYFCFDCKKRMCLNHMINICKNCQENKNN